MTKENFNPEELNPREKIIGGSVPFKDISGWVQAIQENLPEEEWRAVLKQLNVTDFKDKEKPRSKINIDTNDAEGWKNILIEAGIPEKEAEERITRIIEKQAEKNGPKTKKTDIEHKDSGWEEIKVTH